MIKKIIFIAIGITVVTGLLAFYFLTRTPKEDFFNYDPGAYFVTDISDSRRLLKTDIIIYSNSKSNNSEWIKENHRIRDIIIFTLRGKSEEELKNNKIKDILSEEIISKLNEAFDTDDFVRIYFNEFVIQ